MKIYYTQCILPTYFGNSYFHLQGGVLQKIGKQKYYRSNSYYVLSTMHRFYNLIFYIRASILCNSPPWRWVIWVAETCRRYTVCICWFWCHIYWKSVQLLRQHSMLFSLRPQNQVLVQSKFCWQLYVYMFQAVNNNNDNNNGWWLW